MMHCLSKCDVVREGVSTREKLLDKKRGIVKARRDKLAMHAHECAILVRCIVLST